MLIVADVAGKGMPAALLMANLQARIQVLVEDDLDLASLVARLNRSLCAHCPGNRFITFFACEIDPRTGDLTYVNAGHNPPLVVRANGPVDFLQGGSMVLGVFPQATYTQHTAHLGPGDLLALYSDGVTEASAPGAHDEFGEQRLAAALRGETPAAMIEAVKNAVSAFAGSVSAADDFTLLLARRG